LLLACSVKLPKNVCLRPMLHCGALISQCIANLGEAPMGSSSFVWLIAFLDSIVGFTRITICTIYIAHIYATPRHFSEHSAVHAVKPLRQ